MNANHQSFTPYDPADYLGDIEDFATYLEAAIDEVGDDPAVITPALEVIARSGTSAGSRAAPACAARASTRRCGPTAAPVRHRPEGPQALDLRIRFDKTG
ncbi:MAG: hypothetical protein L0H96_01950 [Humibacillus sp.]|nr:hypothetical protein [Humibacillus sp.]MDN5775657.1 hypothetical protein [Humibacillus sp.]